MPKKILLLFLGILLSMPLCIFAAKEKKKASNVTTLSKYDLNKDGVLGTDEIEALKKDFANNKPEGLKRYDRDNNGQIDDAELATIKTDFAAAIKQKKKKKDSQ
jgi:Ca2+-binding EF-hand superfamily protein